MMKILKPICHLLVFVGSSFVLALIPLWLTNYSGIRTSDTTLPNEII